MRASSRLLATGALAAIAIAAVLYFVLPNGPGGSAPHAVGRGGQAHASLRRVGSGAELVVSGMPEPPIGEIYEVWLDRPAAPPHPTDALFTVTRSGRASVDVPGSLRGVREVTVTSEPLGGSPSPTTPPVLRVSLGR